MEPISIVLAGFSGMLGIIIGVVVSSAAREELKAYSATFSILREYAFLIAAGAFLFQVEIMLLLVGLFLLVITLKAFSDAEKSNTIVVLHVILLILVAETSLFGFIASMFLVVGVLEGGWWSSKHEPLLKRGLFKRELWARVFKDHALFLALPFANAVLLL